MYIMNRLIDIILQHKDEFRRRYPISALDDLLVLRDRESMPPTPEGLHRLTAETMDLVIQDSELPQYLAFMDLFHSDVLVRMPPIVRQQFIALTKYFLLQFPKNIYAKMAKLDQTPENIRLKDQYEKKFNQVRDLLEIQSLSETDVEQWVRTMFLLHREYERVVDKATPYFRSFFGSGGQGADGVMRAVKDGTFDKERYDKELLVSHRYDKSVLYFMTDMDIHACYGPDFIGPFGIFHPVSKKCHNLVQELKKTHQVF